MECIECGKKYGHEIWCSQFSKGGNLLNHLLKPSKPLIPEIEPPELFQKDEPNFLKDLLEPKKSVFDDHQQKEPLFKLSEPLFESPEPMFKMPEPEILKPIIPKIELPNLLEEDKPSFLKNLLEPHKPTVGSLPEPEIMFEPPEPKFEPIEPLFNSSEDLLKPPKPVFEPPEPMFKPQEPLFKKPEIMFPEPITDKPSFPPPPTGIIKDYNTGIDTGIRFTEGGIIKNDLGHNMGKVDGNLIYNDSGHMVGKVADDGRIMDLNGMFTGEFIDKY